MNPELDQAIASLIVFVAIIHLTWRFSKASLFEPLSYWLLKKGKVAWAMRFRRLSS